MKMTFNIVADDLDGFKAAFKEVLKEMDAETIDSNQSFADNRVPYAYDYCFTNGDNVFSDDSEDVVVHPVSGHRE